jgi:5-formyltetrahydrofolate cyclo-ligase
LVPGIAFGRGGERLGRGGGFFDRYLANYSGVKIGLCFEIQLEDDLPMQEHDCWMDYVITERDIYKQYHS